MPPIPYNRQTARNVYIWGFLTGTDLEVLMGAFAFNMTVLDDMRMNVVIFGGYPLYLMLFRVGRRPGYDTHLFKSWWTPRHFRPGRREFVPPVAQS